MNIASLEYNHDNGQHKIFSMVRERIKNRKYLGFDIFRDSLAETLEFPPRQ